MAIAEVASTGIERVEITFQESALNPVRRETRSPQLFSQSTPACDAGSSDAGSVHSGTAQQVCSHHHDVTGRDKSETQTFTADTVF